MNDERPGAERTYDEATHGWSCYTTPPDRSLAIFSETRRRCPVAHSNEHDGFYMFLNYEDVRKAAADHRSYSSEPRVLRPIVPRRPVPALEMDPPRHAAWRALFNGALTAKTPERMEGHVRADVERHMDGFIGRGSCDIVQELAEPVPAETICRLVGIDDDQVPEVRRRALAMFAAQGDPERFERKLAEFGAVTVSAIHDRRINPRDDYLTKLASVEVEGRRLEDEDYVVLMTGFLGAGHHSTTSAIASLIYEVFSKPDLRDELLKDTTRIAVAIEETLRLHPPFFGFFRRTTKPMTVASVDIRVGSDIHLGWAAANRDPASFESPDQFLMDRSPNRHLAFGYGIHACPGAALARMEMRVVLEELLRRIPDLRVDVAPPRYEFGGGDYAFMPSLPVTFTPGTHDRVQHHRATSP